MHSALAPASSNTVGVEPITGIGVAMAGLATPLMRPIRNRALAIVAPVLPAERNALALPSRTSSAARTNDESFIVRTDFAGSSSMAITWDASKSGRPCVSPTSAARPTRITGMPAATA